MMFNFNIDWSAISDFNANFNPVAFEQEVAALANIATVAAVNSPAVVNAPANAAPSAAAVQPVVQQVIQAVAPVVAPNVPAPVIAKLEQIIPDQVVSNPQVVSSPAGAVITPAALNTIASSISSTFKNDAQKDAEIKASLQEVASTPAPTASTLTTQTTAKPDSVNLPFDTSKPADKVNLPFDTSKPADKVNLPFDTTTTPSTANLTTSPTTQAAQVQTAQTFTGRGISNDPLMADGKPFTGNRNGIEYKDGVAVDATRADILQADREAAAAQEATARAKSDPLYNFQVRPEATQDDPNFIKYYSWIGGVNTGEWKLYQAPNTPENQLKYGGRTTGGTTAATPESAVGANQVVNPTPVTDFIKNQLGGATGSTGPTGLGATGPTGPGVTTGQTGPTGATVPGQTYTASDGTKFTDQTAFIEYQKLLEGKRSVGQSAFSLLKSQFDSYGLGDLVAPLSDLISEGISSAEMALRLRNDPKYNKAYKERFAANDARIAKGLRALSEAEYINLEDQYQNVMRNYGLPESYYARGQYGKQPGFEKFIAGDVSSAELEDRIQTAQNRVINAAPQVGQALKQFYPNITNGDILAYALDPEQALSGIKRKVQAAEIGGAAIQTGLATGLARAEELQRYGVTAESAKQGFGTIAGGLERGRQLSQIYQQPEYTQTLAETEVFALPSAEKARRERQKLIKTEQATFGGGAGVTGGALARERAGGF